MTLLLVRHGRPAVDPSRPASEWPLDPAAYDDVWALRDRLSRSARWFCSPEVKARETAQLLTDDALGVIDDLREHERAAGLLDDFERRVRLAFADPDVPAAPGWEPLSRLRDRVVPAVHRILEVHAGEDVVLVGHGTAWTVVAAAVTGTTPDLDRWARLGMPDLIEVDVAPTAGA